MLMKVIIIVERNTKLYIRDVAKLTGLSEQLIRKWENRYNIVNPKRLANGYRVYNSDDVNTLMEVKNLRSQNISIRDAVQIIIKNKQSEQISERLPVVEYSPYVEELIKKGTVYDEVGIIQLLKQAHHQYGLALFLQNTVRPFLEEVGVLWEVKTWDESQESMSSLVVKDYLAEVDRHFQIPEDAPLALGFCLPGELHEIPLQIILLQMKMRGWRTTRIGSSPKFTSIESLIHHLQPNKVVLSASTLIPFEKMEDLIQQLDHIAEKYSDIDFYMGGRGIWEYTAIIQPNLIKVGFQVEDIIGEVSSE